MHTRQEPQATAVVSSEAEPRADIDLQKPPSRVFVIAAITLTLLLLAGMLSFLFYRAFTQRAPTNALIVQGDENWQGAILVVDGLQMQKPLTATLDKSNKYCVTFFMDPGIYTMHVKYGNDELLHETFEMRMDSETIGMDVRRAPIKPPATRPATEPAR